MCCGLKEDTLFSFVALDPGVSRELCKTSHSGAIFSWAVLDLSLKALDGPG